MKKCLLFVPICLTSIILSCTKKESTDPTPVVTQPPPVVAITPPVYYGTDTLGSWKVIYQDPSNASYSVVQFPTTDVGYIVDNYYDNQGTFKKTIDGGKTWSSAKNLPTEANQFKVITADIGYAFRSSLPSFLTPGLVPLYQTQNSGSSWYNIFKSNLTYTTIRNIVFPSNNKGYGITRVGEFLVLSGANTNNVTVQNLGVVSTYDVYDMHFPDLNNGWIITAAKLSIAAGNQGSMILNTKDAGKTWNTQLTDLNQDALSNSSIFFYNETFGWATTGTNMIYRTTDGGKNWQKTVISKANGSKVATRKIIFVTSQKGYVLSTNEILETSDGGATWNRSYKDGKSSVDDLFYEKIAGSLWAVSGNRVIKL